MTRVHNVLIVIVDECIIIRNNSMKSVAQMLQLKVFVCVLCFNPSVSTARDWTWQQFSPIHLVKNLVHSFSTELLDWLRTSQVWPEQHIRYINFDFHHLPSQKYSNFSLFFVNFFLKNNKSIIQVFCELLNMLDELCRKIQKLTTETNTVKCVNLLPAT